MRGAERQEARETIEIFDSHPHQQPRVDWIHAVLFFTIHFRNSITLHTVCVCIYMLEYMLVFDLELHFLVYPGEACVHKVLPCVYNTCIFVCMCQNPLWCLFAISMTEHTAASQDKLGQQQLCGDGAADIWHLLSKPLKTLLYQKLSGVNNSLCAFYPDLGIFFLHLFPFLSHQKKSRSTKCGLHM